MNKGIDREVDDDLLDLDSGLFNELPRVGRVTLPSVQPRDLDYEVMKLRTSVFDTLPPVAEVRLDSLAPVARASPLEAVAPAAPEARGRLTSAAVAAGATAFGVLIGACLFWASGRTERGPTVALAAEATPGVLTAPVPPTELGHQVLPSSDRSATPPIAKAPYRAPARKARVEVPPAPAAGPMPAAPPPPAPPSTADLPPVTGDGDALAVALHPELDQAAAAVAIAVAAKRAAECLQESDDRRTMPVSVTFAPSGRVTQAVLRGGPLVGTDEGACVLRFLRGATVGAFEGTHTKVSLEITAR